MTIDPRRPCVSGLLALCVWPAAWAATTYRVEAFGDMGYAGRAINEAGVVVGGMSQGAFQYQNGVLQLLGRFGSTSTWVVVHDINDLGVMAGGRAGSNGQDEAFLADHGTVTPIPGMSVAMGLNNAGMVFGESRIYGRPVVWTGTELRAIGSGLAGDQYSAKAINAAGQVVGERSNSGGQNAYTWRDGAMDFIDLPGDGYASDINDLGEVVGWACAPGLNPCRGYRYANGVAQLIAPPPTLASSWFRNINNSGDIIGHGYSASGASVPFLLDGAGYTLLNDVLDTQAVADGWRLFDVDAFNDAGQIVGRATRNGLWYYSVLLTPVTGAVPEPAPWQLWLLAAALLPVAAGRRGS